ncbi:MAG: endonuclease domain-containing protein [Bacteroidetes bacterium]|nr:endonuclease domain-containing protein [Bacteroidota bacterium]
MVFNFKSITELARDLRKNQTPAEAKLWAEVRNRKLNGIKFFRQHPIVYQTQNQRLFFFIADFYSNEISLVIEVDGKIHDYQKDRDEQRDIVMREKGLNVLRFKNEELENIDEVKKKILFFTQA